MLHLWRKFGKRKAFSEQAVRSSQSSRQPPLRAMPYTVAAFKAILDRTGLILRLRHVDPLYGAGCIVDIGERQGREATAEAPSARSSAKWYRI
jgi:hypothetical protein